MSLKSEFANRRVVITGAGGELGSVLTALFYARGALITGCDQSEEAMENGAFAMRRAFDLTDPVSTADAAAAILDQEGVPDVLINNAGWTRAETLCMLDGTAIDRELDLNLAGVMRFTNPVARAMARKGAGSIVFVSSVNALAHYGNPAYSAAKAGINAFARAIAVEYGKHGVRANVVCPGSIRTPAWDHRLERDPAIMDRLRRLYPLGRIVEAREVAEAIAFLASDRASGITGTVLPVDAGLTSGSLPFIEAVFAE